MVIKFLGHAAFLITTASGAKIVTDPYEPGGFGGAIGYGPLEESADFVVISHDHADHNYVAFVPGNPTVIQGSEDQTHPGLAFRAILAHHDSSRGSQRGENVIRVIEADRLRICHLGDLGHPLSDRQVAALGPIDVLMIPVGGTFTVDAKAATALVDQLQPRIAIPMHYKTDKLGFDLAPVDDFLAGKPNVRRAGSSELRVSPESLPEETEIMVLEAAL